MKKGLNIFGVVIFSIIIVLFFVYKKYQKVQYKEIIDNNLNVEFYGKIDSLYIDYQNRGWLTIVLSNNKTLRFNGSDKYLYKKNDSLIKRKGEDSIHIYRDGIMRSYKY